MKYTKLNKIIEPDPILLVKNGKIVDDGMKRAKISRKELES